MALSTKDAAAPDNTKKRRRRVPTSGAAEDCFGCRKRGTQCDRRRPYCSQCLETSKDCPGYRTTLTWGVGVASRGKLRGLSLPVANSSNASSSSSSSAAAAGAATATSSSAAASTTKPLSPSDAKGPSQRPRANTIHEPSSAPAVDGGNDGRRKRVRLTPLKTKHSYPLPPAPTSYPTPFPSYPFQQPDWQQTPPFYPPRQSLVEPSAFSHPDASYKSRDLFPLHTAVGTSFPSVPWSPSPSSSSAALPNVSSGTPTAESDTSTGSFPHTPNAAQTFEPYFPQLAAGAPPHQPHMLRAPIPFGWQPTPQEDSPSYPQHHQSHILDGGFPPHDPLDQPPHLHDADSESVTSLIASHEATSPRPSLHRAYSSPVTYRSAPSAHHTDHSSEPPDDAYARHLGSPKADGIADPESFIASLYLFPGPALFQLHPRMQFLLNYYDQAICPVLVAQDGPANPYRQQIMQLAMSSPGLQSAIAALTMNNLRMRRLKDLPRSDLDLRHGKDKINAAIGIADEEEQHYRSNAIDLLNKQLSDPTKSREDSVLATLLMLGLFHVCDSGFSKFKTQLAGVQRLLRFRAGFQPSEFIRWVEMFFARFDVLTSALNEREADLHIGSLDLVDLAHGVHDAEQYSGCDGRLLKLISRLSRLNFLSQSRPVKDLHDLKDTFRATPPRDFYSLSREGLDLSEFYNGDLNPLGSPSLATAAQSPSSPSSTSDVRQDFWLEWQQLRDCLQSWQPGPAADSSAELRARHDMQHVSEVFRWAALVYVERLADPAASSDASSLQDLVSRTLFHVREISEGSRATKFLLWPLFVAGTECVDPEQRDLIRARCVDILRDSGFYNNLAVLDLLERHWAAEHDADAEHAGAQTFRWRRHMDRTDGEYIIV